ncbi:MAG: FliM/FliN family flagellar motor switch protein [Buchnera aphidicola (Floraphis choui)]
MVNNTITEIKENNIKHGIKKSTKVCIYDSKIDYYTIHQTKKSLMMISNFFSKQISLALLDNMNLEFDIELNSIQLEKYDDFKSNFIIKSKFLNSFQIIPYFETGIIRFSDNIVPSIINFLFGGKNFVEIAKNRIHELTISEINIMKKMVEIIQSKYSASWKQVCDIDIKFSDFQLVKNVNFKNIIFLSTIFQIRFGNILGFLNLGLPLVLIKTLKDKLTNKYIKNDLIKKKTKSISWPVIHNIEINLDIKLVNFSLLLSRILKLKIGDIISIKIPEDIIAYVDDVPVLVGKYKIYKEKRVFFLKYFFNSK